MSTDPAKPKKKRRVGRIILVSLLIILTIAGIFLYNNFNRLLSEALIKSFNANIVSDVYELKFEKLRVNFFEGSMRVVNVELVPRETPLRQYNYINSSFQLKTEKIMLENVQIFELLRSNRLILDKISINKPDIQVLFTSSKPIFLPFKDSTKAKSMGQDTTATKRTVDAFSLREFQLLDASFSVVNAAKRREFDVVKFSIVLKDLLISQQPGRDEMSFKQVGLSVDEFSGRLGKGGISRIGFRDLKIEMDALQAGKTLDTVVFHFDDLRAGLKSLDVQTADSLFHLTLQSFNLSYKDKQIKLDEISFTPNIKDAEMQNRYEFQHTQISGSAGSVQFSQLNFDSLIFYRSLFIDEILVDKPMVSIFKDNTKPVNKDRFPKYFGQQIAAIPIPLRIKEVKVKNVNLTNVERKRDSSYAKVTINRGTVSVKNITNLSKSNPLTIQAEAYVADKVHFNAQLDFSYKKPEFNLVGKLGKFDLPDLNPVLLAYTPGKIDAGVADELSFSGTVGWTSSTGSMTFLYHDLKVDLELQNKAKWKSSVIAFAANSIVNASNPGSDNLPPRIVTLHAERDMNKGFVNIIIKSILNGVKETMIMSKENRKAYKQAKQKAKQQGKSK